MFPGTQRAASNEFSLASECSDIADSVCAPRPANASANARRNVVVNYPASARLPRGGRTHDHRKRKSRKNNRL